MKLVVNIFLFFVMCLMIGLWSAWTFAPDIALAQFQVSTESITGINALKSDMGGAVLGIGLFILLYFIRGTKYLKPLIILVGALLLSRIISLVVDGFSTDIMGAIGMEIFTILAAFWVLKYHPSPVDYTDAIHPDFRKFRFLNMVMPDSIKPIINKFSKKAYDNTKMSKNVSTTPYNIKGYQGKALYIEMYQLDNAPKNSPCIIAFHGGGFWAAPIPGYKLMYDQYLVGSNAKLIYVDYTLSIDGPYPSGVEDCYAAALWAYENSEKLGIDKNRIAITGDSAGGALTAAVTQMLRDRNQFKPCFQLLVYPLTDDRLDTESAKKYRSVPVWNTKSSEDSIELYLKNHKGETPAYAYPLRATDFSNLPPAYIEVAEYDSLRDEAIDYAEKLKENDIEVNLFEVKGGIHGFELNEKSSITKEAIQRRIQAFRKAFEK